jgi:hypothetical protein
MSIEKIYGAGHAFKMTRAAMEDYEDETANTNNGKK